MVDSAYFVKSATLRAFIGSFQCFADMLQTYWKMCMKQFGAEKIFFYKLTVFLT